MEPHHHFFFLKKTPHIKKKKVIYSSSLLIQNNVVFSFLFNSKTTKSARCWGVKGRKTVSWDLAQVWVILHGVVFFFFTFSLLFSGITSTKAFQFYSPFFVVVVAPSHQQTEADKMAEWLWRSCSFIFGLINQHEHVSTTQHNNIRTLHQKRRFGCVLLVQFVTSQINKGWLLDVVKWCTISC